MDFFWLKLNRCSNGKLQNLNFRHTAEFARVKSQNVITGSGVI